MNAKHIVGSAALAAAAVFSGAAAQAEDGVWRVGNSFVIRHENLDLETPEGRRTLLGMIEKAAWRACRNEPTRSHRLACVSRATEQGLAQAPAGMRDAAAQARLESPSERSGPPAALWAQR